MAFEDKRSVVNYRTNKIKNGIFEFLSKRSVLILLTIVPALLLFLFVTVAPVAWTIYASFYSSSIFSQDWTWVGLSNYHETLTSPLFWESISRSLMFAGGSVIFQLTVGVMIALVINESFTGSRLIRSVIFIPYLIPTAVIGFLALWMGNPQWGVINGILVNIGIIQETIPWFGSPNWAMLAVILTGSWKFTIFVTIMVTARLQSIPDSLYEAATMCGANSYQKFRDITLPNLKGIIFIVLLLRGVWMFNKYDIIEILTRGGPGEYTTTAAIYAYDVAFTTNRLGRAAAVSVILFVFLAIVAILYFVILEPEEEVRVE